MALAALRLPLGNALASGSIGDRTISPLLPYIGLPQRAPQYNPGDRQRFESFSLMDIFSGTAEYIGKGVNALISTSYNNYMITEIMPLERHDQMNYIQTKIDFPKVLIPQTGPQAPFENAQAGVSMESFTLNRYAFGITASAESLKTDTGKAVLEGGLINIAVGFADTMEQACFMELLTRPRYYVAEARKNGIRAAPSEDPFAEEKSFFDCIRKGDRGYFGAIDKVRSYMGIVIPTAVIVPEGFRSLVASDPAESEYFRAGPDARGNAVFRAEAQMPNLAGGLKTYTARGFTLDDGSVVIDPLGHDVTIGDHFRCEDYTTCTPADQYDRCHRRIYVFDMSIPNGGDFGPVELMYAIRNSERFINDANGSLAPLHETVAANAVAELRARGIELEHGQSIDPFLYRLSDDSYRVCQVVGQQEDLSYDDIRAVAETLLLRMTKNMTDADQQALREGLELIQSLNDIPAATVQAALLFAGYADGERTTGAPEIPAEVDADTFAGAGYGSVAGLRAIARNATANAKFGGVPSRFNLALERLWAATKSLVVDSHPCINPAFVPSGFASSAKGAEKLRHDSITTFGHNLLDENRPALYNAAGAGGVVAFAGDIAEPAYTNLNALRLVLRTAYAPQNVQDALGTVDDAKAFAADFADSQLAQQYASARRSKRVVRGAGSDLDTTFETFLNDVLARPKQGVATLISNVIGKVKRDEGIPLDVERWIDSFLSVPDASNEDNQPDLAGLKPSGLTVPYSVAASVNAGNWRIASSSNTGQATALQQAADRATETSRRNLAETTVHTGAFVVSGAAASESGVGSKRGRDAMEDRYQSSYGKEQQPTFFDPYMRTPGDDNRLHLARSLTDRFARAHDEERDTLRRVAVQMVLLAPICLKTYDLWDSNHVRVPLSVLGERPLRVYHTSAIIVLRPGKELGMTVYNGVDAQLGANAVNKTFHVHISMWFAPIIVNQENYYIIDNAVVNGYSGGESLRAHKQATFNINNVHDENSVFFCAVPYGSLRGPRQVPRTHDIRGRYSDDLIEGRLSHAAQQTARRLQWSGALYYDMLYGFSKWNAPRLEDQLYFQRGFTGRQENTVTFQTMQYVFCPQTKQFTWFTINTDHFGPNIYPGHGRLRTGAWAERYKDMEYEKKYVPFD